MPHDDDHSPDHQFTGIEGAADGDPAPKSEDQKEKTSQRDNLIKMLMSMLVERAFWHDADGLGFVTIKEKSHQEHWSL